MEFILNEYHRDLSDENLLEDLTSVAIRLHKDTVSCDDYSKFGKYNRTTITRRFGSWSNALKIAGLKSHKELNNWCTSLKEFIEDVRRVACVLKQNTVTTGEYKKLGKFNHSYPQHYHCIGWNEVLRLAELESTSFRLGRGKGISNEELFADIERVWIKLGRQPTITDLKKGYFKFSQNTFCRRFGGWRKTLIAFVSYMNSDDKDDMPSADNRVFESCDVEREPNHQRGHREPNLRLRFKVMQRDNFKCCICGRSPATDPSVVLVLDHIYPWAKGGDTIYDNLQTLCKDCNLGKSDPV